MKFQKFAQWLRIILFSAALIGCCITGFIPMLRPTVSEKEGRVLTRLPEFSWSSFWSGEYTSDMALWYSDTFPGRDALLDMNGDLKALYGIQSQSFGGGNVQKDEIDLEETFVWNPIDKDEVTETGIIEDFESESFDDIDTEKETDNGSESETDSRPEVETGAEDGGQVIEGYYVEGNTAYELYYFKNDYVNRYTQLVTQVALDLDGLATVYDMVIPTSCNYGISAEKLLEIGASNQSYAIDYIYRALNSYSDQLTGSGELQNPIVTLDIRELMGKHYDEYIYFRTDHHWTGLGAYYASRYFLDAVGKPYPALDDYRTVEISGFLGSLYNHTQSANLKNAPDTVYAYESPTLKEIVTFNRHTGEYETWPLIKEAGDLEGKWNKYLSFSNGDCAFYEMHNETIKDGSAVLVIRESFGNAFMPMLVDSYEYVYGIDYRFWRDDLALFVEEHNIDTVIFLNNIMATANDYTIRTMETLAD